MAALRNTTLGLLRQTGATNIAAALRHYPSLCPPRNFCSLRIERPWDSLRFLRCRNARDSGWSADTSPLTAPVARFTVSFSAIGKVLDFVRFGG